MNWIKSNPFVAGLIGVTILLCGVLFFLGSKWSGKYDTAKAGFDEASQSVVNSERTPLYPTDDNRNGKQKALGEYRESVDELRKLFDGYRPEKTENISPQAFTDRLKAASNEVAGAFGKDVELPENFFLGFEEYSNRLAPTGATGMLLHQLDGIRTALTGLAAARPSSVIKVYREPIPEERGGNYKPAPNDVARYLSFEVTFKGSESSAREFLSSLGATESHFLVVRCLKIQNERDTPPTVSDAEFEPTAAEAAPAAAAANPFGFDNFFEAPAEDPAAGDADAPAEGPPPAEGAEPGIEEGAAVAAPPAEELDSSRILAQVLGGEELIVFVRFDIALFLPTKDLPKP